LSENSLTGDLPRMDGMTSLKSLLLGNNKLTGPVPPMPARISHLQLQYNQLSGRLEDYLSDLPKLRILYLKNNSIYGILQARV
jgi:hypothetical protein